MHTKLSTTTKYIFVSGGVISGLGKGILTASISMLLKQAGFVVAPMKIDMYLNVDAGTMNPLEHGEVFVTEDGKETDQDLGHYERYTNVDLYSQNYMTMGQIYWDVLKRERALEYKGKCVEGHIHIPEEIISKIKKVGEKNDVVIVEVGGTVGEYQNMLCYEAIRRFKQKYPKDTILVHTVYLPVPKFLGEMKSKPAQNSIYDLYRLGITPDFVVCRSEVTIDAKRKNAIAFNTGILEENIIAAPDVDTVYKVPLILKEQQMAEKMLNHLGLTPKEPDLKEWNKMVDIIKAAKKEVKIAIAGKYFTSGSFSLEDSYVCVIEAIKHATWANKAKPIIKWFDVERFEKPEEAEKLEKELLNYDGIIVPQGWGSRGVEGKLKVVNFARTHKIPYLGLCFGMQMAVIEYARNVLGIKGANSAEVDEKTKNPVVHVMPEQLEYLKNKQYGGTIRLGAWPCKLKEGSIIENAYKKYSPDRIKNDVVQERHRHRYEFNNDYKTQLEGAGLIISGTSPDGKLVEVVELDKKVHPFFVATQFHPEYKSRFLDPHPLFVAFVNAIIKE